MTEDLTALTATELVSGARTGDFSVERIARSFLDRIADRDGSIRAWACLDPDRVLAEARALDAAGEKNRLFGLPVGLKDVIDTADMPTRHNSPYDAYFRPGRDAACVDVLRAAGALVLGKTETVEFAAYEGQRPSTRNPHDLARTPGGSSSGSAAAVADRHVPIALGTQTAGSLIRPASFCGIYAFKPTWGAVSREGVKYYSASLDTLGWYARAIGDLALLCDVFEVHDDEPYTATNIKEVKIAVCEGPEWPSAESETAAALHGAADALADAGAQISHLLLPAHFSELGEAQHTIMMQEGSVSFLNLGRRFPQTSARSVDVHVAEIRNRKRHALRDAYDLAALARCDFDRLASRFDVVLTPSSVGCAPEGLQDNGSSTFNRMWTLLHVPCVNIPYPGASLPVGLTLTGPRYSDRRLLQIAALIDACLAA
ncbi:MAG: amidase [Alphaproteobacteria bacterium]|nr:amidase [Alphaproteobacteria bacterium]